MKAFQRLYVVITIFKDVSFLHGRHAQLLCPVLVDEGDSLGYFSFGECNAGRGTLKFGIVDLVTGRGSKRYRISKRLTNRVMAVEDVHLTG